MNLKRHATPIVLLIIAVVLGVYLWRDKDQVTETERKRRENNVFVAWRRDDLSKITIAHHDETITLEREVGKPDASWRMSSPRNERVDQAATERLLTTLEFATVARKVGSEREEQLGLGSPRASGTILMGALTIRFALGAASPRPEGSSYFKVDDGAPFVASRELTEALLATSDTLRDRTVIPYLSIDLARFELKHAAASSQPGGFVVERFDERSFKVKSLNVFASRNALDKVWGALAEMRAESFPKDADADRLTANPKLTFIMTPKDKDKPAGELVVGDTCPGHPNDVVVLRKAPTRVAACAPKGAMDALLGITPELLVDKKPFGFRHDEIEELRLERVGGGGGGGGGDAGDAGSTSPPRVIEVARRGTGYHEREPADRELDADEAEAVTELIQRIEHDPVDDVRANNGAPFVAIAKARVRSGEHDEVVEVGSFAADARVVTLRRVRDDALLTAPPDVARRLIPRSTTLRGHRLMAAGEAHTAPVKRVLLKCGTTQELIDEGAGLRLVEPKGYETDSSITQLVDGALKGKVLAWVSDTDASSAEFGISSGDDACRMVVSFADNNAPLTIRFGKEGEGGVYGSIDGHPEVFVVSTAMYELARRIYVSHSSMRAEASQIESVRVTLNDKVVSAGRDQKELRDAASALFADRVLSIDSSDIKGKSEVEIEIALAEGGPKKRVACSAVVQIDQHGARRCSVTGVKAVFEVLPNKFTHLLPVLPD